MTEDDSESYNLVNIHAPTANLGFSIVVGLVLAMGLYRLYRYFLRAKWGRLGRDIDKERRGPVPPPTALVDGDSGGSEGEADAGGPPADPHDPQDTESESENLQPGDGMDEDGYSSLVSTEGEASTGGDGDGVAAEPVHEPEEEEKEAETGKLEELWKLHNPDMPGAQPGLAQRAESERGMRRRSEMLLNRRRVSFLVGQEGGTLQ